MNDPDYRFLLKYGPSEEWESKNTELLHGEPGIAVNPDDSYTVKFGPGHWNDLPSFIEGGGVAGPPGPEGPQGPAGATGATGSQGPAGATGATGAAGAQGPPGADGADGADGVDGEDGTVPTNAMLAFKWNGSTYVASVNAGHYVGPNDPGSVPDGSIWDQTP